MKDLQWFPPIPEPCAPSAPPVIWSVVVGAAFGGLLLARGHGNLAIVVWAAALLLALGLNSPAWRRRILRAAHWLGACAGRVTTLVLLWPFYALVFGAIHLALSVARVDLLGLRLHSEWPSYWQPAAPERKRAKYYERLFTVEPARQGSHFFVWAIGILAFALILAGSSEMILRSWGFGNPIIYRVDPRVGYYPAPNQDVHRYGGEIHINAFGMRSRNVTAEKAAGTFRILMLGDSTLYGGSYIDQREIYASRLEDLLNQKPSLLPHSPRNVEVLCMGVNGWGPQHELAYVQEFGLFHADLVMVMGPPADAYRPRYGIEQFPFFAEGHRPNFAWQELWEHLRWEYRQRFTTTNLTVYGSTQPQDVLAFGVIAWYEIALMAQEQNTRVDFEFLPNEEEARQGRASEWTQPILDALLTPLARLGASEAYPVSFFRSNLGIAKLYHDGAHLATSGHKLYAFYLRDRVWQLVSAE
jgi:hypothetical protein